MYITDLTHFLDESGAIAPIKGAARAMAQFVVEVVGVIVSLQQIDTVAADQAIDGPVQGLGR